ncbi:Cytochrome c, mono-and diheme variants [Collimonas sp. OK242]|uniref:cytochrome c n=1 Tax=Collimonas sp. OK242 TaxID=1798195 RepID=UPI00089C51E7|nr:cytochrome c [Collimonas sp. OK242]SDY51127.1 Cytochrome c, mono-and diheme variants [Collimonas sp. OK242]
MKTRCMAVRGFGAAAMLGMALWSLTSAWAASDDTVQRGKYLATAADCIACHTAAGGKPFAGGVAISTPLGAIISTNITPSENAGIGAYTLAQFTDALRKGKRADGAYLYPAMPYTAYASITDEDVAALYAYFMQGVVAVDSKPAATRLPFPFNVRSSLAAWNAMHLDGRPFVADPGKSAEINRGAYLGQALAHCSACHTPRGATMGELSERSLGGNSLGSWYAPNISSDVNSGVGSWSTEQLTAYLKTGRAGLKAQTAGPMAEAVDHSLRNLTEPDLRALALWLKQTPPIHDAADTRPPDQWGTAADYTGSIRGVALPADRRQMTGPQVYDAYCATCHQASGKGTPDGGLPPLFHNTALGHANGDNLVMAILQGVQRQADVPGATMTMPAFARTLSDQQIVTLSNFLTQQFGHPEAKVTVQRVGQLRAGGTPSPLLKWVWPGTAGVIVLFSLLLFRYRRRHR